MKKNLLKLLRILGLNVFGGRQSYNFNLYDSETLRKNEVTVRNLPENAGFEEIDKYDQKLANVKASFDLGLLSGVKKRYIRQVIKSKNPNFIPKPKDLYRIPDVDWDVICKKLNETMKPVP